MDKLKKLIDRCACGIHLTINGHRDYYDKVGDRLKELALRETPPDISEEVKDMMIAKNTIIELHFCPDTPIGFYEIFHYDLDEALTLGLKCVGL